MTRLPFLLLGILAAFGGMGKTLAKDAPIPNPGQLKARALASMRKAQQSLERYSCSVHGYYDELNDDGSIKKHSSRRSERFFVNGVQIDHVLARNGKDLTGVDAKREQEKADKQVRQYSDRAEAAKKEDSKSRQTEMFLRAQRLSNGRRESRWGRDTIAFDMSGDPNFQPHKAEERLTQALSGRIWIDEESGTPVELQIRTDRDVRIGGGLVASLHKGFELKLIERREADGTWLEKSAEGNGDVRAALFFHPRFRFREDVDSCHLYAVDAQDTQHDKPPVKP